MPWPLETNFSPIFFFFFAFLFQIYLSLDMWEDKHHLWMSVTKAMKLYSCTYIQVTSWISSWTSATVWKSLSKKQHSFSLLTTHWEKLIWPSQTSRQEYFCLWPLVFAFSYSEFLFTWINISCFWFHSSDNRKFHMLWNSYCETQQTKTSEFSSEPVKATVILWESQAEERLSGKSGWDTQIPRVNQ